MNSKDDVPGIICRSDLQPRLQKIFFLFLTACAWALWVYLLLPLARLLMWHLGLDQFSGDVSTSQIRNLPPVSFYVSFLLLNALLIVSWSQYNIWRYSGKQRRKATSAVTPEMTCERFLIDPETLSRLQLGKIVEITIDDREMIHKAEVRLSITG